MQLKDASLLRMQAYVDGKWIDAANRATCEVTNPATGERIGTIPALGAAETRAAIGAAAAALPAWSRRTAKDLSLIHI